jgi:mono/diheme cytochrome c family protein
MRLEGRMLGVTVLVIGFAAAGLSLGAGSSKSSMAAPTASLVERGRYLATVGGCNDCHTPGTLFGGPDFKRALSGSEVGWRGPWGISFPRNLTPDPETGLGNWSTEDIVNTLKTGVRKDGSVLLPPMPWPNTSQMTDADLHALATYLKSLPPVKHQVPKALPPDGTYAGPAITFPAPGAWDAPAMTGDGGAGGASAEAKK